MHYVAGFLYLYTIYTLRFDGEFIIKRAIIRPPRRIRNAMQAPLSAPTLQLFRLFRHGLHFTLSRLLAIIYAHAFISQLCHLSTSKIEYHAHVLFSRRMGGRVIE